jgi:tRNA threonylcarbamoyladenosine biosynthesis protein TsaB
MNRSLILGLETCTPVGSVCLLDADGNVLGSRVIDDPKAQSVQLAAAIMEILVSAEATWDDLEAVAVSIGPGSFTGVRLGLSLAKGICATGTPKLVGVNTLEAMAFGVSQGKSGLYIPVLNARLGEVYAQAYDFGESGVTICRTKPFCGKAEELSAFLLERYNLASGMVFGQGAKDYEEVFPEKLSGFQLIREEFHDPSAEWVGRIAQAKMLQQDFIPQDVQEVLPVYLRNASVSTPKKTS